MIKFGKKKEDNSEIEKLVSNVNEAMKALGEKIEKEKKGAMVALVAVKYNANSEQGVLLSGVVGRQNDILELSYNITSKVVESVTEIL